MPPKGDIKPKRTQPVNEQILKESARIYDNRELCDEEDDVRMMKGNDLISFAKFLSKEDAFTKVSSLCTCWQTRTPCTRDEALKQGSITCAGLTERSAGTRKEYAPST